MNNTKNNHDITKAKWVNFFQIASDIWLKKKRASNNKYLEASPTCDRLLHESLWTDLRECNSQVITRWVNYNYVKRHLVIFSQDNIDMTWLSKNIISAGLIYFKFKPNNVDQPVSTSIQRTMVFMTPNGPRLDYYIRVT